MAMRMLTPTLARWHQSSAVGGKLSDLLFAIAENLLKQVLGVNAQSWRGAADCPRGERQFDRR